MAEVALCADLSLPRGSGSYMKEQTSMKGYRVFEFSSLLRWTCPRSRSFQFEAAGFLSMKEIVKDAADTLPIVVALHLGSKLLRPVCMAQQYHTT